MEVIDEVFDEVSEDEGTSIEYPEGVAAQIWKGEESMAVFEDSRLAVRMAIALYYRSTLHSLPRKEWERERERETGHHFAYL